MRRIKDVQKYQARDVKAPDGMLSAGWRLVRSDGVVHFANNRWQHEKLKAFVGKRVWVVANDYWYGEVLVYVVRWELFICQIKA